MLSDFGYALSAVGYTLLLLLLFTVRKAGLAKYLLILATAVTALWSVSHIVLISGPLTVQGVLLADTVKQLVWLIFLAACLKDNFHSVRQVFARPASWAIIALPLIALLQPYLLVVDFTWRVLLQTMIALQILILLELLYRQAGENGWAFKPLILFLGATNLYEFVSYANATMVAQLEPTYIGARGYIYAVMLPFLVLAIRRIKHWGVDIFISREVVLHSSLLLVAGAYLFIMALAGYAIKYVGGNWGATVQIVLIALSLVLLATLLVSNSFRTRIKVFITKHFFANQFDYRIEWLKLTQSLETQKEQGLTGVYHSALNGILRAIDYDSGLMLRWHKESFSLLADIAHGPLRENETQLLHLLADYCQHKDWIVDIEELRYKPFVYEGLKVNHALLNDCSFQWVLPIYHDRHLWGLVLLQASNKEPRRLNWELRDYLTAVVAQAFGYVFHYEAAHEVAENAQFAAFNRMSAFVLHDLKNVLAQIDLILCNAELHKHNPEFIDDTFETLQHTKTRMEKMLRQLTEKNAEEKSDAALCLASAIIRQVIDKRCMTNLPLPQLVVHNEQQLMLEEDKFANVIYHLLSNAQQATADHGYIEVTVKLNDDKDYLLISIKDNGIGMSETFIQQRLFKPFDTTKGNAGMGIGAYDAKNYMEKLGGQLQVHSEPDKGSTFTLYLPLS